MTQLQFLSQPLVSVRFMLLDIVLLLGNLRFRRLNSVAEWLNMTAMFMNEKGGE